MENYYTVKRSIMIGSLEYTNTAIRRITDEKIVNFPELLFQS